MHCIEDAFNPTLNIQNAHLVHEYIMHPVAHNLYASFLQHALHASSIACIMHCMNRTQSYTSCRYYTSILVSSIYFWNSLWTNRPTDIATYRATIAAINRICIFWGTENWFSHLISTLKVWMKKLAWALAYFLKVSLFLLFWSFCQNLLTSANLLWTIRFYFGLYQKWYKAVSAA